MSDGKVDQVGAAFEFGSIRIIKTQTALVAGAEIHIFRDSLSHPLMTGTGFQVPNFVVINESNAEAFAGAVCFNNLAQELNAFGSGMTAGKNDIDDVIFGNTGFFVVRIDGQCVVTGKNGFRTGHAEAGFVKADGTVQFCLPVGNRGVAHSVHRLRIAEIGCAVVILGAIHRAFRIVASRMNDEQLSLERRAIGTSCN